MQRASAARLRMPEVTSLRVSSLWEGVCFVGTHTALVCQLANDPRGREGLLAPHRPSRRQLRGGRLEWNRCCATRPVCSVRLVRAYPLPRMAPCIFLSRLTPPATRIRPAEVVPSSIARHLGLSRMVARRSKWASPLANLSGSEHREDAQGGWAAKPLHASGLSRITERQGDTPLAKLPPVKEVLAGS
jgi:hypothetical protein